jgi:hypothetical protein
MQVGQRKQQKTENKALQQNRVLNLASLKLLWLRSAEGSRSATGCQSQSQSSVGVTPICVATHGRIRKAGSANGKDARRYLLKSVQPRSPNV